MESNANQKVSCVVNYPYDAMEQDELTIRQGDVVREVDRLPGGWWRGELRGRTGMFPDNFVSVLTEQNSTSKPTGVQGRCRAVFSYQPANPDELPLCVGDVLDVISEVEEGWWRGRRQGHVGVFPSNFVVMLDPFPTPPFEPAPALPPKPVKEQCRVLFPYSAVNEDELTLTEGDVINIVSKDAPDKGWWKGEIHGKIGLFPDNFVQLITTATPETEEKKPERPPLKSNSIYPVLNKYSEKTASVKELTTSKTSLHKENTLSKDITTQSSVTHTNKSESEKIILNETIIDGVGDGQTKKPPVPLKKSPTPTSGVGGLFSGLKSKMLSSDKDKDHKEKDKDKEKEREKDKEKEKTSLAGLSSASSSSGEWDRADGAAPSRSSALDLERHSLLNDPRAQRAKAPRRRPPSQALSHDLPTITPLSNGHEVSAEKPPICEKTGEEIKPRAREWEKHKAPWMEELKLNQAKKTSFGDKSRSASTDGNKTGSTDRILECGLEEKRSTHSMEMSKSTSSISSRISVLESLEESITRHSLDSNKKDIRDSESPKPPPTIQSPTAAGRTLLSMLDEIKKPATPTPPAVDVLPDKSPNAKIEKSVTEKLSETSKSAGGLFEKTSTSERVEKVLEKGSIIGDVTGISTIERRTHTKTERDDATEALIAQLNNRVTNLEKLLEVQNAKFTAAIEQLSLKLAAEVERRQRAQDELRLLAHV